MTNNYRDLYYGSILDPLHGDIKLSEIEKWCIGQPIFSRLRRVKQNTFLYYVFPSANHTRFEHSIGVMHIAGKIFDSCKENFATGKKKIEKYSISDNSSFFDLGNLQNKEGLFYQELRLAALLHDLGHGPMSHLFDKFSISKTRFLEIVKKNTILSKYELAFSKLIGNKKTIVEHELISCVLIFDLIAHLKTVSTNNPQKFSKDANKIIGHLSAERIVKLIEPDFENLEEPSDDIGNNYTNFFSRIVTSFPIDADRMDYLLRDSYFSGVTYGIYDINRIFASFLATIPQSTPNKVELCFKESGIDSILRFIQSRSHLFNQVYFHKTNRAVNTMLSYCTSNRRQEEYMLMDSCQSLDDLKEFYIKNSDEVFLNNTIRNEMCSKNYEKEILDEIISRKLFKRVFQIKKVFTGYPKDKLAQLEEVRNQIDLCLADLIVKDNIYAITDYFENITFKDSSNKSVLLALKNEEKRYTFTNDWKQAGQEYKISDMSVCMIRIYLRRSFKSPAEFEDNCKKVTDSVSTFLEKLRDFEDA